MSRANLASRIEMICLNGRKCVCPVSRGVFLLAQSDSNCLPINR